MSSAQVALRMALRGEAIKTDSFNATSKKTQNADSVIYLSSLPDCIKRTFNHPELIDRVVVRFIENTDSSKLQVGLEFKFNNVVEINHLLEDLNQRNGHPSNRFDLGFLGFYPTYTLDGKTIERRTVKTVFIKNDTLNDESYRWAVFGTARIKTIYHLPGKVKKVTIPRAIYTGNICDVDIGYADFFSGKSTADGIIRYK